MTPLVWLGILAILLVIEAITVGLTTVWFAGGALIACVASWLGLGIVVQLLLFFGVSVVLLIFTRPLGKSSRSNFIFGRPNGLSAIDDSVQIPQCLSRSKRSGGVKLVKELSKEG